MCCLTKRKSKCIGGITLLLLLALAVNLPAAEAEKSKLTTPTGVRLLKNKSFDDSEKARMIQGFAADGCARRHGSDRPAGHRFDE
jgi:hypothetical protein